MLERILLNVSSVRATKTPTKHQPNNFYYKLNLLVLVGHVKMTVNVLTFRTGWKKKAWKLTRPLKRAVKA